MLTHSLIKAARNLLGWRQEDLAAKSGISVPAINKLERGITSPRQFTLETIQQTFEREGLEFIEGPGLRLTDNIFNIKTLSGSTAPIRLWGDIIETLKPSKSKDLMLSGLDESQWIPYKEEIDMRLKECKKLNISWRALIKHGDTNFAPAADIKENYRWISKELFTQIPHYIYKDKLALVSLASPIRIIIIQHKLIAESYRAQFEQNWKNGEIPRNNS